MARRLVRALDAYLRRGRPTCKSLSQKGSGPLSSRRKSLPRKGHARVLTPFDTASATRGQAAHPCERQRYRVDHGGACPLTQTALWRACASPHLCQSSALCGSQPQRGCRLVDRPRVRSVIGGEGRADGGARLAAVAEGFLSAALFLQRTANPATVGGFRAAEALLPPAATELPNALRVAGLSGPASQRGLEADARARGPRYLEVSFHAHDAPHTCMHCIRSDVSVRFIVLSSGP
jgi:hypothetical protein